VVIGVSNVTSVLDAGTGVPEPVACLCTCILYTFQRNPVGRLIGTVTGYVPIGLEKTTGVDTPTSLFVVSVSVTITLVLTRNGSVSLDVVLYVGVPKITCGTPLKGLLLSVHDCPEIYGGNIAFAVVGAGGGTVGSILLSVRYTIT
jgi:hypothetical protein